MYVVDDGAKIVPFRENIEFLPLGKGKRKNRKAVSNLSAYLLYAEK